MNGQDELKERLAFIGIDPAVQQRLKDTESTVCGLLPEALSTFYAHLKKTPETARFFRDDAQMAHAKNRQEYHWSQIAHGHFDDQFVRRVTQVGEVHARIGLEPRWYIGGYARIVDHIVRGVLTARWPKGRFGSTIPGAEDRAAEIGAIIKAAMLDMDYAIAVYLNALDIARVKVENEAKAIEAKQAAVRQDMVTQVMAAMSALAKGNLSYRMSRDIPDEYKDIPEHFNEAMTRLAEMVTAIKQTSNQIYLSSHSINEGAKNLSDRSDQQATALEEAAATSEQLAASVKTAATSSGQSVTIAHDALRLAEKGGNIVGKTVEAMVRIEEASKKISENTAVIDEIAFQTNLLALNAGVEAARAGEAGLGFAVVASEVRALAKRSAEASQDIKRIITVSGEQVSEGVKLVRDAGDALREIVAASNRVLANVNEISSATKEQAIAIEELAMTVSQMDGITQQNAQLAEESVASATMLDQEMTRLDTLMSKFEVQGLDKTTKGAEEAPANTPRAWQRMAHQAFGH